MRKKKPAKRKSGKKKSASRKMNRREKPIQRKKAARSKTASAPIHQGVGPEAASQSETASGVHENDAEYGGES